MPPKLVRKPTRVGAYGQGGIGVVDGLAGVSDAFPRLIEADVASIGDNPDQPRTVFDEEALRALSDSIERHGLQQPILIAELPGRDSYRLVAGERRLRAHQMLGRPTIFAIITSGKPEEIALIENVQRQDLDAVDLARGLERLMTTHGYSQEEVGSLIGKDASGVSRHLSVLRLPPEVLEDYQRNQARRVSASVLMEIAAAEGEEAQRRLWGRASGGLTVKEVRAAKVSAAGPEDADSRALVAIGKALRRIGADVRGIGERRALLRDAHFDELEGLRDQINRLLAGRAA